MASARLKMIAIIGPTASGKSAWAVSLAKQCNGVVISADSRQVYKGLDVGTEKINKTDRKGIKHFMLDVVIPTESFTVADYQKAVYKILDKIARENKTAKKPILPIIAGGTGLYVDAVCEGFIFPKTTQDKNLRAKLDATELSDLVKQLLKIDPDTTVDLKNKRRVVRALEIALTGTSKPAKKPRYEVLKIGIELPREDMDARIHERAQNLDLKKLASETKRLIKDGLDFASSPLTALYYAPTKEWLEGDITREELLQKIESANRKYARRQLTWWRKDRSIKWVKSLEQAEAEIRVFWSGRHDSNVRPPRPKRGALPTGPRPDTVSGQDTSVL